MILTIIGLNKLYDKLMTKEITVINSLLDKNLNPGVCKGNKNFDLII